MSAEPLPHLGAQGWFPGTEPARSLGEPAHRDREVAVVQDLDPALLDGIVAGARGAAAGWAATPVDQRCAVLRRAAVILRDRSEVLGRDLAREEGKVLAEAVGEVVRAADVLDFHAGEAHRPHGTGYGTGGRPSISVIDLPVGVVAAITPWNFPMAIPAWKLGPALALGNTVVWKPSPLTPLSAVHLGRVLLEAGLPLGVLSLVHGDHRVGAALVAHDVVDAVTFTGSTAAGRAVITAAARPGTAVQAELGGQNAVIVCADADLAAAAAAIAVGAFSGNGQKCTATSRVLAHRSIIDALLQELAAQVAGARLGDPLDPTTTVGPLVSQRARDDVLGVLATVEPEAALIARTPLAESLSQQGWFVAPAVYRLSAPRGPLWTDEVFGPVVAVLPFDEVEEALALANDTAAGMAGAVFTDSRAVIDKAVARFDVGMLAINGPTTGGFPHVPFGGWKASGFGPREQGTAARQFFTRSKTVTW